MRNRINRLFEAELSLIFTFRPRQNSTALTRLLIIGLALFVAVPSHAAKHGGGGGGGGGGSAPAGTIYYLGNFPGWGSGTPTISMNADGSNAMVVGGSGGWSRVFGNPSLALHNNSRWFVAFNLIPDQFYADGSPRKELFAFRDDYNADPEATDNEQKIVQLTDDVTLDTHGAQWLLGDDSISVIGRRWSSATSDATVNEGGIYVMPLVFDTDGNIIGLGELPTTPTIPLQLVQTATYLQADVSYYSWAPTGDMFVYTKLSAPYGVWVADIDGTETMVSSEPGHMAEWSPDGTHIVYGVSGGFVTIKSNGKSRLWVLRKTSTWEFYHAFWSPDSDNLVFTGQATADGEREIFRINANGGDLVQLTAAPYGGFTGEWNAGWR